MGIRIRLIEHAGEDHLIRATLASVPRVSFDAQSPDLIVVVLDQRQLGDEELVARERSESPFTPMIAIVPYDDDELTLRIVNQGAQDCLARSEVNVRALRRSIGHAMARARAERMLVETRAKLDAIVSSAMDAIITVDGESRIVLANPAAERIFGWSASQMAGMSLDELMPDASRARHREHVRRFASTGRKSRHMTADGPVEGVRKSGERFPIEASISRVVLEGQRLYTAILRDVSEHKALEAQYMHAQKMEAVGRLAGGVAHDFNNILTIISSYAALLRPSLRGDDADMLDEITRASERAGALTRQLLAFSRKDAATPRVLDMNEIIGATVKMLQRLIGSKVTMTTSPASTPCLVYADSGHIEQILMNLAVNAGDAMPGGGRLEIATSVRDHVVQLTVSDTGCGMDETTRARIFEPFFTTKAAGKGTGLGLATVYAIVAGSGGRIEVRSAPHEGTTFDLFFPEATHRRRDESAAAPERDVRGRDTILLVEEEPALRTLAVRVLREHGYGVLAAETGEAALRAASTFAGGIDLLVTETNVASMEGRDLAGRLRHMRPTMKVLFMSGRPDDANEAVLLHKPFTPRTLAAKVREVLDAGT